MPALQTGHFHDAFRQDAGRTVVHVVNGEATEIRPIRIGWRDGPWAEIADGLSEAMSGSSPWFVLPGLDGDPVQVMSGATIADDRQELGASLRELRNLRETRRAAPTTARLNGSTGLSGAATKTRVKRPFSLS